MTDSVSQDEISPQSMSTREDQYKVLYHQLFYMNMTLRMRDYWYITSPCQLETRFIALFAFFSFYLFNYNTVVVYQVFLTLDLSLLRINRDKERMHFAIHLFFIRVFTFKEIKAFTQYS